MLTITPPPTPEIARCRIPLNQVIQNRIGSWGQTAWIWMAMWCPRQLATITDQQTHFQTLNTKLFHQQEHLTKHLKQQINIADLPDINMDQLSQMARQAVSK
ncbi:MAG: hypothetical protein OXQ32_08250 [bacterium]|nr:hypothetical protein [bacterium]